MSFDISYAEVSAKNLGLVVTDRPSIPTPTRRNDTFTVRGRDGSLRVYDGAVEDIEITVNFAFYSPETDWMQKRRIVTDWLISRKDVALDPWLDQLGDYILDTELERILLPAGSNYLYFSDDPDYCYRVKHVKISDMGRQLRRLGTFKAAFTCDGYEYLRSGLEEKTLQQVAVNLHEPCKPIYKITGNGTCALIVNGKTFRISVGGEATIDSECMIAYRSDGMLLNTDVTGDYESLWLKYGANTLSATANFTVRVIPRWRCL